MSAPAAFPGARPALYASIFLAWGASLFWFHPRLASLMQLAHGPLTAGALGFFIVFTEIAWLYGFYNVGVIVFACTTGSLVHGIGWDRELIGRIERAGGRPATTTTTAVLAALRAVGATSLAIATPYMDDLNRIERAFFAESGFRVAEIAGLGCATDAEIGRLEPEEAAVLAERVDTPDVDAVFISCTNWHCLPAVASMERRFGKPVVTSNQAGAWAALRRIGIEDAIPGHGRLLSLPIPMEAIAT